MSELDESVGVAPLVVVPGDDLAEARVERDAGVRVEDRGAGVSDEVGRDNCILGVAEDSLEVGLGCLFHLLANFVVGGVLRQLAGQINNGDVGGGHAEGHASQFAVELRDNLADSFSSASGARDDIGSGSAAGSPVLAALGGTVDGQLVDGHGVNSGHQAFSNTPVVVKDFSDGSEAVGGAGGVRDDGHVAGVLLVVNAHYEHGSVVLGWAGDDGLLSTALQVEAALGFVGEDTARLADVVGSGLAPWDGGGVLLAEDVDKVAIDLNAALCLFDRALEAP